MIIGTAYTTKRSVAETATPRDASNPPKHTPGVHILWATYEYVYYGTYMIEYVTELHHRKYITEYRW